MRKLSLLLLMTILVLSSTSYGWDVQYAPVEKNIQSSAVSFVGKVIKTEIQIEKTSFIQAVATIKILKCLKGECPKKNIKLDYFVENLIPVESLPTVDMPVGHEMVFVFKDKLTYPVKFRSFSDHAYVCDAFPDSILQNNSFTGGVVKFTCNDIIEGVYNNDNKSITLDDLEKASGLTKTGNK